MENQSSNQQGAFDFIDRLIDLFHHTTPQKIPPPHSEATTLNEEFETALHALEQTIEKRKEKIEHGEQLDWQRSLKSESEEVKKAREEEIHLKIREDINAAHTRLQTGITPHNLDVLKEYLDKVSEVSTSGEHSQEVLPRCSFSILKRIHFEAGILAFEKMNKCLAKHNESWPARIPKDPTISTKETQEIVRRNQINFRKNFINYSIHQSSLLIFGIVEAWKSDYPEAGSDLWNSVVLEAVTTALRAKLMHIFTTRLRHDRDFIENKAKVLIGAKLSELNRTLKGGITSVSDAHRAVSSSLKILDEVIPGLAWEHLQQVLPEAKQTQKDN